MTFYSVSQSDSLSLQKTLTGVVDRESPSVGICARIQTLPGELCSKMGGGEIFRHSLARSQVSTQSIQQQEGKREERGRRESGREDGRDSFTSFFGALRKKVLQPHSPPIKVQHPLCREVGNLELYCRVRL